jgi:hypothetical protein
LGSLGSPGWARYRDSVVRTRIFFLERRDNTAAPWVRKQVLYASQKGLDMSYWDRENERLGWEQWRVIEWKG